MPYCPKCDMEFVDGITKCTDCGGPLFESKEKAVELMKKAEEARNEQMRAYYEKMMQQNQVSGQAAPSQAQMQAASRPAKTETYVDKGQKYEDMKSSATAFFIMGGACILILALTAFGVITLPFYGVMKIIVLGMLVAMAVGSFAVAFSSKDSADKLKGQVSGEKQKTEEIIAWFLSKQTRKDIDRRILSVERNLGEEEMTLRRFELIQDYLITGQDLTDQSYVDMLCEEIYSRLYDNN